MSRSIRSKNLKVSKGFTLIELIVVIAIYSVLNFVIQGHFKNVSLKEEIDVPANDGSLEAHFSLRHEVIMDCALKAGIKSRIIESNPGTIILPNGDHRALQIVEDLSEVSSSVDNSSSDAQMTSYSQDQQAMNVFMSVKYDFDEIAGTCKAIVDAVVPRDAMFSQDSQSRWIASELAQMVLNVELYIDEDYFTQNAHPLCDDFDSTDCVVIPTMDTSTALSSLTLSYQGVIVGNGIDSQTDLTATAEPKVGGCGLMEGSKSSSIGFWVIAFGFFIFLFFVRSSHFRTAVIDKVAKKNF